MLHRFHVGVEEMAKGRKRNITDQEIALIKAMLRRGIPNDRIHFYFNRADRLVSSGRITQIKHGKYGGPVPEAGQDAIDTFLADWDRRNAIAGGRGDMIRAPTDPDVIRALFEKRGRTGWFLVAGETDQAECKAAFSMKPQDRFADPLRSIAGLANNKGGYVFFGVKDKTFELVGLRDDTFKTTDSAEFSRVITTTLDPVPRYEITCLEIDGKTLGVIYVPPHDHRPVIAIKAMGKDLREGTIYYRYVGESKPIKPGELRQLIAYRERQAVAQFAKSMTRVADGSAATLDLNSGKVEGHAGAFVIDRQLLPELQFIREGEFSETKGAPTLRLIGEVRPAAQDQGATASVVRRNVTDDAVLRNFLQQASVAYPVDYLQRSCHTQRHWLPMFYYLKMAGLSVDQTIALFDAEEPPYPTVCKAATNRLKGTISAFRKATGSAAKVLSSISSGAVLDPNDAKEAMTIAYAIGGLTDNGPNLTGCLVLLQKCLAFSKGPTGGNLRSQIYRAACRLDELMFKPGALVA
jgi:Putative DNA-binding domain